ncbi:OLEOSIN [Salix koriyanagi]|uniref:Oleosin n=1 Tax=Salix koriyanagi TaxID=2511006 RepID=A0A9Q0ZT80_9ROSI|nr:OLEOSIN [Salix koriyanagi]
MTAGTIGAALLVWSGLTLTGTVIAVVVATPVIVMFSPILVPAAIAVFSVISGIVFSSGRCLAAVMREEDSRNVRSECAAEGNNQVLSKKHKLHCVIE